MVESTINLIKAARSKLDTNKTYTAAKARNLL
jgi:hypothetical protein